MIHIRKNNQDIERNDFWIGFSDLMTGLMLVFIVVSLVFIIKAKEDALKTNETKKEINKILIASQNEKEKIEISKKEMLNLLSRLEKLKDDIKKAKEKDNYSTQKIKELLEQTQKDKKRMEELIAKAKADKDKLDEQRKNIIMILSDKLQSHNIKFEYDSIKGTVTIAQDILFTKKQSDLNKDGKNFIEIFANILDKNIFNNKEYQDLIKYIHIEGYASNEGSLEINFLLSFNRAKNVWLYMTKSNIKYKKVMQHKLNIVSRGEIDANQIQINESDRKVVFRFEFYDTYNKIFEGLSK